MIAAVPIYINGECSGSICGEGRGGEGQWERCRVILSSSSPNNVVICSCPFYNLCKFLVSCYCTLCTLVQDPALQVSHSLLDY